MNSGHEQSATWKFFEQNKLTHSAAHYLMTIKELREEFGYARKTDVAKRMEIQPASCTLGIKSLKKKGLVAEDENKFLLLTKEGIELASMVEKNERLFEQFFREVLGVEQWQAEVDACKIEHLISPKTANRLCAFLKFMQSGDKDVQKILKKFQTAPDTCCGANDCTDCGKSCGS